MYERVRHDAVIGAVNTVRNGLHRASVDGSITHNNAEAAAVTVRLATTYAIKDNGITVSYR